MRKKWLVIGGVGLALLGLIFVVTLLLGDAKGNACEQFLQSTLENKPEKSYGVLAESTQEQTSEREWKKIVADYFLQYASTKTAFKRESSELQKGPEEGEQTTVEKYLITTSLGKIRGTCYLDENQKLKSYIDERVYEE